MAALSLFADGGSGLQAIDLGCGDGTETLMLLGEGWRVLAIDREPEAIALLGARVPAADQARLEVQVAAFPDVRLAPAHLVFAGYSLPFCRPDDFPALWQNVIGALRPGGVLACHLLGPRDTWAQPGVEAPDPISFHSTEAVGRLLDGLEAIFLREFENDKPSSGGSKHWHIFEIIVRRPASAGRR